MNVPSYNKVILVGRLTRDPDMKYTPSGTALALFTLAVDRNFSSQNRSQGSEVDSSGTATDFIRIVAFNKRAEFVGSYLKKGRLVLVEGRLQVRGWQAQDGTKRYSTEVIAERIRFMETKAAAGMYSKDGLNGYSPPPPDIQNEIPNDSLKEKNDEGDKTSKDLDDVESDEIPF
ncbi:MAG: single-stranded DNA-binding protein [Thermotogae bacterium]|nr:single-stranded DNA-binding protein [Thermotogota bacterium]